MNWLKLIDLLNEDMFNEEFDIILADGVDLECEDFNKHMVESSAKVIREVKNHYKEWFKESHDMLIPLPNEVEKS